MRAFPPDGIRVSDADRDLALAELSEHFQTGRELSELFGDLPRSQAGTVQPPALGVSRRRPGAGLAIVCAIACVIIVDALFSSRSGHHVSFGLLVPVLVVLFVIRRVRAR